LGRVHLAGVPSAWTITRNFTLLSAIACVAAFAERHSHQSQPAAINASRVARCAAVHLSHQSGGGDIGDNLLGKMAKQTKLSRRDFEQLVDCYLSREKYDSKIAEKET
jgi:hypothetical protein